MIITFDNAAAKAAGMLRLSQRVGVVHLRGWAEDVAQAGEDSVRNTIDIGGINPTKKGGPRVKTGSMRDAAEADWVASSGSALVKAGFGIKQTPPLHTIFQEGGTSRGITPMLAIPTAAVKMDVEAQNSGLKMMAAIKAEWETV